MARKVTVKSGQSIFDIALQEYGSVEGVYNLMQDNPARIPSLDVDLLPGDVLLIGSDPVQKDVTDYYTRNSVFPATRSEEESDLFGDFNNDFNDDFN